eukprot:scaffold9976_cov38-Phaeocystis_antarctica.AAC.1
MVVLPGDPPCRPSACAPSTVVLPGYPPCRPSACAPSRAVRCASTSMLRADRAAPRLRTAWTSLRTPRSWVRHMLPVPRAEL